jgi:hypothetical protein
VRKARISKNVFLVAAIVLFSASAVMAATAERWIHVRVENVKGVSGNVSFNFPIEMASSAISMIPGDQHNGKFHFQASINGTDLRALLDAVRRSPDNVFVTIERRDKEVSVAKSGRSLLIKIADKPSIPGHFDKTVAIKVPVSVVRAMLAGNSDDLDVAAGIHALALEGEVDVTMNNEKQTVRVWTDTRTGSN